MEKTTKKNAEPQAEEKIKYSATNQASVDEMFLRGASATTRAFAEAKAMVPQNVAEAQALGGGFALYDPIETCVGPIGRFLAEPENFPLHPAVALFGQRRTGKSYTLRYLMFKCFRDYPFGMVLTRTKMSGFWDQYVPPFLVIDGLQQDALDRLIARQTRNIKKWKKDNPEKCKDDPDAYKAEPSLRAFVILDDVISDRNAMMWNTQITSLFVEGRHMCISVFICTQYPKGVGPMIRGNCDLAIFQPIFQRPARETLADLYGGWMDRQLFYRLMDDIVIDENLPGSTAQEPKKIVRTMFVNAFENTKNPQIKFKYNEAEDPGKFRLCDPALWKQQDAKDNLVEEHKDESTIDIVDELDECRYNAGFF